MLNEGQALCVCALSRAPNAPRVRRGLIEAFMELRRGRRLPKPPPPPAVTHGTVTCDGQVLAFDPTVPVRTLAHGTRVVAVHWDGRIAVETLLVDTTYNRRCGGMSGTGWELYLSRAGFARDPRADPDAADPPVVRVLVLGPVVAAPA